MYRAPADCIRRQLETLGCVAGSGANMALQDSWELAQELVNGGHSSIQAAITHFGEMAAPRSVEAIEKSHKIIGVVHSEGLLKLLLVGVAGLIGFLIRRLASVASFKPLGWTSFFKFSPGSKVASKPMAGRRPPAAQKRS